MTELSFDYANLPFIEQLYESYHRDRSSVDLSWRYFFEGMELGLSMGDLPPFFSKEGASSTREREDIRVFQLVEAYRTYGHRAAKTNPLAENPLSPSQIEHLCLKTYSLEEKDLARMVPTYGIIRETHAPLSQLIDTLQKIYCTSIGFEYRHLSSLPAKRWLEHTLEGEWQSSISSEKKTKLFSSLTRAQLFEEFLQLKYPGQKRFSLEGGETLIPLLEEMIDLVSRDGAEEVVLGMAHRGRLNVLANVMQKPYSDLFREFEPEYRPKICGAGDVKYHKGYQSTIALDEGRKIQLTLCDNPSHLESIDPITCGKTRALQEIKGGGGKRKKVVPILIHGDAAIAGQGIVYETMQLFQLPGYRVGGTLHLVVNNQVGFTAVSKESKSTFYCTDLSHGFEAPVFHMNAEDPETCIAAVKLATAMRRLFGVDVFMELNCYRKYGHNETDEPSFTQPLLYEKIRKKTPIRSLYGKQLESKGVLTQEKREKLEKKVQATFERELETAKKTLNQQGESDPKQKGTSRSSTQTAIPLQELQQLAQALFQLPEAFHPNPKIKRMLDHRREALTSDPSSPIIDWGTAEMLAYATLLTREKKSIRLTGQDSGRGTFSHRHAVIVDQENGEKYYPLNHLSKEQAPFRVHNSLLSEYAALGFEYGYSLISKGLTIWEAQFGDFSNGAQIVIDQYIASGESKWQSESSLVLFLPHGYEGQGPEHSSGRIERCLQLAADDNLRIVVPTTASQMFHLLRLQALKKETKPLIIFTPKALLRFPPSLSSPKDLGEGAFCELLDDPNGTGEEKTLLLCSGKVYYDLLEEKRKTKRKEVVIVRLEQLYPFAKEELTSCLTKYKNIEKLFWVQEEHQNMGAWDYIYQEIQSLLPEKLDFRYVGRKRSASPSAGWGGLHREELQTLLKQAFAS